MLSLELSTESVSAIFPSNYRSGRSWNRPCPAVLYLIEFDLDHRRSDLIHPVDGFLFGAGGRFCERHWLSRRTILQMRWSASSLGWIELARSATSAATASATAWIPSLPQVHPAPSVQALVILIPNGIVPSTQRCRKLTSSATAIFHINTSRSVSSRVGLLIRLSEHFSLALLTAENIVHAVVPFKTCVLVDWAPCRRERKFDRPGLRKYGRIINCRPVKNRVRIDTTETLYNFQILGGSLRGGPEVRGFDNQRIAFPMANRIAEPQSDVRVEVRTSVQVYDANLVIHFMHDHNRVRRLDDLMVVVIAAPATTVEGRCSFHNDTANTE